MGIFNIFIIPEHSLTDARWISLKQAAHYSNIGQKRLISLAESSAVVGFRYPDSGRGDWIFDRESLDEYRLKQADPSRDREKVMRLMQGVG
jgi:hypothetical protein